MNLYAAVGTVVIIAACTGYINMLWIIPFLPVAALLIAAALCFGFVSICVPVVMLLGVFAK